MEKLKYLIKRLKNMNFKNFFSTLRRIHKKSNKNFVVIFCDMIYCGFKYMAGYVDYEQLEFYNLKKAQRKTIITRGINNKIVKTLNDINYFKYIDDKVLFNEKYNDFLNREWIDLRKSSLEDFTGFLTRHKTVMAKTINLCCGKGIEKITYDESVDVTDLYNSLKNNNQFLIEEYVYQHRDLNKLHPYSVNTLRIVSILKNENVFIPFTCLRIGNKKNVVDNFNSGGLLAIVNENGIIENPAIDKEGNIHLSHPYTNVRIVGYQIPLFEQAIEMVKKLALITPEIRYTAWDISITSDGPVVIEGNPFPGHDVYQSKLTLEKNNVGLFPVFKNILAS